MAGDDTDQEEAAVGKHLAGMRERMAGAKEIDTDEVSIEVPEPDEADEEDETAEAAPNRRERRAGRMSPRERAAAAEAEAKVLREQLAERNRPVPGNAPSPVASTAEVDRRIRSTYAELQRLEDDYARAQQNRTLTAEKEAEMRERAIELDIQKATLAAERRDIVNAPRRRQDELTRQLERENADVYGDARALQFAAGRVNQLIAEGRKDSKELHDEVMEETRRRILGKRPKPDAIERQRATGLSAGPRVASPTAGRTIPMPRGSHYYKMAVSMYPELDAGAACQKWAQTVGKKLLAKQG
jgi:hypothetical protein